MFYFALTVTESSKDHTRILASQLARLLDIMIDNGARKYWYFLLSCFLSGSKQ